MKKVLVLSEETKQLLHWYEVSERYASVWVYIEGKLVKGKVMGRNAAEKLVRVRQWQPYTHSSEQFDLWLEPSKVWRQKAEAEAVKDKD